MMMRFFFSSSPSSSLSSFPSSLYVIKSRESEIHVFKVVFVCAFLNFLFWFPSFLDGCWVSKNKPHKTFSKNCSWHKKQLSRKEKTTTTTKQRWKEEDHQPEGAQQPFPPLSRHFPWNICSKRSGVARKSPRKCSSKRTLRAGYASKRWIKITRRFWVAF